MADPSAASRTAEASSPRVGRRPVATMRLQLGPQLDFQRAADLAPYLESLGITEAYLSPVVAAAPGSAHGYDITRHDALREDLGGEAGFQALADGLSARGLGLVLDLVPNHMGVDRPRSNPWWWDVLENGNCSPFARYFDIDWDPVKPELQGRVLLPILGDQYGRVLERGELRLEYEHGAFLLRYWERQLPINPRRAPEILRVGIESLEAEVGPSDPDLLELLSVMTALGHLPSRLETDPARVVERQREKEIARERLDRLVERSPRMRRHVEEALRAFNGKPGDRASFDRLHRLLEGQTYRLAYWRTAFHEINYRRFFDVNGLASVRMEDPEVFEAAHGLILRLVSEGRVTGLRLDHLDGLADPADYLERLRASLERVRAGEAPLWVLGEKILSPGERLHESWPFHGTTGYEFLHDVLGLFVNPEGAGPLQKFYLRFTRRPLSFDDVEYHSKRVVMTSALAGELNLLAHALNRISEGERASRDFTLNSLHEMLLEVVASFPVYRTYVTAAGYSPEDRRILERAAAVAQRRNPGMDAGLFGFFLDVMLDRRPEGRTPGAGTHGQEFTRKFQQYTGPVQAKGVEDTAFYRHAVLLALNDVGGDPQRFGRPPEAFHAANAERLRAWPLAMTSTATHDTKRGEDARARLAVLSEIPSAWRTAVQRWARLNAANRTRVDDEWAPDRGDEYLFYQTLIGTWPATGADPVALAGRLSAYMIKAIREAKLHTSWINEHVAYEQATRRFVESTLTGRRAAAFLKALEPMAAAVARLGMVNSLATVLLKCASPGVPDFYQGTELWDLSLVDPDNRRPVDFERRRSMLAELEPALDPRRPAVERSTLAGELLARWEDGRIKMLVTAACLRARRGSPEVFLEGEYVPLVALGPHAGRVVALARRHGERVAIALAPRLAAGLAGGAPPVGECWTDTTLVVPPGMEGVRWRDAITGREHRGRDGLRVADVLGVLPVALLEGRGAPVDR